MLRFLLAFCILALTAHAEERVVAALSQDRVAITANFDGSEILIFGAVKRDSPTPGGEPLEIIITISGPLGPVVVRRKSRRFGIWMNTDLQEISKAPSFYAIASTGDIEDILGDIEDLPHKIRIDRLVEGTDEAGNDARMRAFESALIRIRESNGLYATFPVDIEFLEDTLFSTHIALPANLIKGTYSANIYFVRDNRIIDSRLEEIVVQKVGLGRWIYDLAHEQPLLYGLLALAIAIVAGWLASLVTRIVALMTAVPRPVRPTR